MKCNVNDIEFMYSDSNFSKMAGGKMKNMPGWMTSQEWVMTQHESLTNEAGKARLLGGSQSYPSGQRIRFMLMLALTMLGAIAWWLL